MRWLLCKRTDLSKLILLIVAFSISTSWANQEESVRQLTGYQPSYFVIARDGVDEHIEFNVSIKYPIDKNVDWLESLMGGGKSNKLYFAYTGQYDFFVFSDNDTGRESSPIVSRIQNPGIFLKHEAKSIGMKDGFQSVSVGWFHESNGQQIDDNATFLTTANATDFVSRGWDYLGIDTKFRKSNFLGSGGHANFYLRLRIICGCQGFGSIGDKEDDIRILGGTETADIRDFDGFRFIMDNRVSDNLRYGLHTKTGLSSDATLENWSYRVELTYEWDDIPITFFYFDGYGVNLSTYHIKDDYIGVGIKIW